MIRTCRPSPMAPARLAAAQPSPMAPARPAATPPLRRPLRMGIDRERMPALDAFVADGLRPPGRRRDPLWQRALDHHVAAYRAAEAALAGARHGSGAAVNARRRTQRALAGLVGHLGPVCCSSRRWSGTNPAVVIGGLLHRLAELRAPHAYAPRLFAARPHSPIGWAANWLTRYGPRPLPEAARAWALAFTAAVQAAAAQEAEVARALELDTQVGYDLRARMRARLIALGECLAQYDPTSMQPSPDAPEWGTLVGSLDRYVRRALAAIEAPDWPRR